MTGVETAQRLRVRQPTVVIMMISGTELPEESARVVDLVCALVTALA
jgi:hypothetical protein